MAKTITAIVHPKSKHQKTEKRGEVLHIYVSAPALEGRANEEAKEVLAEYLRVKKSSLRLKLGNKDKHKVFEIYE